MRDAHVPRWRIAVHEGGEPDPVRGELSQPTVDAGQLLLEDRVEARLDVPRPTACAREDLRDHDPVVERTRELGIAFVPFFPVSFDPDAAPGLVDVATRRGLSPQQVALAWLLHRGPHVLPIPGTTSVEHLAHNLAAARVPLDERELAQIDDARRASTAA